MTAEIVGSVRTDIQALRAIAIASVVVYHFAPDYLPGGFLGVDVFFVISGYLISGSIIASIDRGSFRPRDFWIRRIRRLFPALAFVSLATLIAAYFLMDPNDASQTAKATLAAAFSVSNFLFWKESGYFDAASITKPMLHTWSLGVEEQFYLVWPFVLLIVQRPKTRIAAVAAITALSFVAALCVRRVDTTAAFFLMPLRMFELGIGSMMAMIPMAPQRIWTAIVGFISIAASLFCMNATMDLPGTLSLVPCLGTAAVIYAGNPRIVRPAVSIAPVQFLGNISYSLYLVHWPLFVFAGAALPPLMLAAISIALATLLYYFVEQQFRTSHHQQVSMRSAKALTACAVLLLTVSAITASALATGGWKFRLPQVVRNMPPTDALWASRNETTRVGQCFLLETQKFSDFQFSECLKNDPRRQTYTVIGDSLAADIYSVLSQAYPGINFKQITASNCRPLINWESYPTCKQLQDFAWNYVAQRSDEGVVLHGVWSTADVPAILQTLEFLRSRNLKVILVGAGVRFAQTPTQLIYDSHALTVDKIEAYAYKHRYAWDTINSLLAKELPASAHFVDLASVFTSKGERLFTPDGHPIFIDHFHLTRDGAAYLAKILSSNPSIFEEPYTSYSDNVRTVVIPK
jgi:peptidoglycan/LPS O-acetylase OafA/YrhL